MLSLRDFSFFETKTSMKQNRRIQQKFPLNMLLPLAVSPVALRVLALPGMASARLGAVVLVTAVDTTGLLAGRSKTTSFAVLFAEERQ